MADGGWDQGETIFIGANGERTAQDGNLNRREAEAGFKNFLLNFRDADESFAYRYGGRDRTDPCADVPSVQTFFLIPEQRASEEQIPIWAILCNCAPSSPQRLEHAPR